MDILDQFTDDVTEIDISNKNIFGILDFKRFTKLIELNCEYNQITGLDNLPNSLIELCCYDNKITNLDNLCFWNNKGTEEKCIFKRKLLIKLNKLNCDKTVKDYKILMEKYNKL